MDPMKLLTALLVLASAGPVPAHAQSFQVEHEHLRGSCKGELVFSEAAVEYKTSKAQHARTWKYEDIQQLEIAPRIISVLTYQERKLGIGPDKAYNFKLVSGQLDDSFRREIQGRLSRPLVSRVLPQEGRARYTVPVRHKRFMGGDSEGVLELTDDAILYRAQKPEDSRIWLYKDLLSCGSTGPFQLRLGVLQKTGGEFGEEKNYVFDLKRRLEPEEYDFIWEKINRPRITGR